MNDWQDAEDRAEKAQQLFEAGQWDRALEELRAALRVNPFQSDWLFGMGLALDALQRYPFPGNVRELASAMERAVTFCEGDVVQPDHLPARIRQRQVSLAGQKLTDLKDEPTASWPTLETLQQRYVQQVMERVDGNKRRAARILGINRRTLYRWLEQRDNPE